MPWFKVDDGLWGHPKWLALAGKPGARALWVTAGSWSAANLTDGQVPRHVLVVLGGKPKDAAALVEVGLWLVEAGGWSFHQWTEPGRQPTREDVEAKRAEARDRMQRNREQARQARERSREQAANVRANFESRSPYPDPTRPDPTRPKEETPPPTPSVGPPTPRGHRLPDDFEPDAVLLAWVRANCPDVPRTEHDKFVDHWRAQPGAKGRKLDWPATWRNWMRRAQEDIRSGRRPAAGPRPSTTDQRVSTALALAERYDAEDGTGLATVHQLQIGDTA